MILEVRDKKILLIILVVDSIFKSESSNRFKIYIIFVIVEIKWIFDLFLFFLLNIVLAIPSSTRICYLINVASDLDQFNKFLVVLRLLLIFHW